VFASGLPSKLCGICICIVVGSRTSSYKPFEMFLGLKMKLRMLDIFETEEELFRKPETNPAAK